jgi:hypothetical protein
MQNPKLVKTMQSSLTNLQIYYTRRSALDLLQQKPDDMVVLGNQR